MECKPKVKSNSDYLPNFRVSAEIRGLHFIILATILRIIQIISNRIVRWRLSDNFTKLGNDAQVPPSTVAEYVGLLEDTLVGFLLPAWTESRKRKAIKTGKFYFFDPGVTHALAWTETLDRNSNLYGKSFEQFICMELRAYLSYKRKQLPLTFWRSKNGHEVDFLIGTHTAIEVKASQKIGRHNFKGLRYLQEEGIFKKFLLVSQDPISSRSEGILCIHWEKFLADLWNDKFV